MDSSYEHVNSLQFNLANKERTHLRSKYVKSGGKYQLLTGYWCFGMNSVTADVPNRASGSDNNDARDARTIDSRSDRSDSRLCNK